MYCVLEARKNCCCRRRQLRKVRLVVAGLSPVPRAKATAGARRRYKVQVFITSSVAVLSIPMYCLPRTHATYALQYVQSILSYYKKKKKKKKNIKQSRGHASCRCRASSPTEPYCGRVRRSPVQQTMRGRFLFFLFPSYIVVRDRQKVSVSSTQSTPRDYNFFFF